MKVALALYSIRDFMEEDFQATLQKVKDMGYDGVEFAGLLGHKPAEVRDMLSAVGLIPISAHVPITELAANPAEVVAAYKEVGCPYIAIPWLDEADRPGHENWDKTKASIEKISEECKKQGITLLYHNHDFEFEKDKDTGEYALDRLFREIPVIETEIDTCWVKVAGVDPPTYVRQYKGRAPIVHLKDFFLSGEKPTQLYELIGVDSDKTEDAGAFEFRPVGHGVQDFPKIIDAAIYSGAQWVVVEQDAPSLGKSSLENALMSIEYLATI